MSLKIRVALPNRVRSVWGFGPLWFQNHAGIANNLFIGIKTLDIYTF